MEQAVSTRAIGEKISSKWQGSSWRHPKWPAAWRRPPVQNPL